MAAAVEAVWQKAVIPMNLKLYNPVEATRTKYLFFTGKGRVGKTTVAAAIALGLRGKGRKVRLATTDPADHLNFVLAGKTGVATSHIDEQSELAKYKEEVLSNVPWKPFDVKGEKLLELL